MFASSRPVTCRTGIIGACALLLSACANQGSFGPTSSDPAALPEIPPAIKAQEITGRWGLAAYHKPDDRGRTEVAAAGQCKQPYVITMGSTGGVMMHLADQSKPEELRMKGAPGNKTYIGPAGEAGGMQDREVVAFDGRVMILRFVDPEVAGRYGSMVYVRCGPRA